MVLLADGPPAVTAVRNASDGQAVRVAVELSMPAEYKAFTLNDPARIVLDFKGADSELVGYSEVFDDPLLRSVRVGRPEPDTIRVVLELAYLLPYEVAPKDGGAAFEVRLSRGIEPWTKREEAARGIVYSAAGVLTDNGPLVTHVLDVDMNVSKISLGIAIGEDRLGGREALTSMAGRRGAAAAINGGYFIMDSGTAIDMLIVRGKVLILPERFRGFFGIDHSGKTIFMRPRAELSVRVADRRPQYVHRLNWPPEPGMICLYTPEFGTSTGTKPERREVIVRDNKVSGFSGGNSAIPPDGFVISADDANSEFVDSLKDGDPVEVIISSYPDLQSIEFGITAGPTLISGGMMQDKLAEDFNATSNIVVGRNPRTAVGRTKNNHIVFAVVEGRSTRSIGMSLEELAAFMKSLGAVDAINLDGGGSSEMVIRGKIMNNISDGKERPLANALLVFTDEKSK
jgi:hypothetical protein